LVFRRFFERIVKECAEAGLFRGEEPYFDATKVDANASFESIAPRFAMKSHLDGLFEDDDRAAVSEPDRALPTAVGEGLKIENASGEG
jgi:hypothetical protein